MEYRQGLDAFLLERPLAAPGPSGRALPGANLGRAGGRYSRESRRQVGRPAKARDAISYDRFGIAATRTR